MSKCRGIVSFMTAVSLAALTCAPAPAAQTLHETGSTLLAPLLSLWAQAYNRAHPDVAITVEATGSGAGIDGAIAGIADIGASDVFVSAAQAAKGVSNIPLAISAQLVAYNIPEVRGTHLHIGADALARIYAGRVTMWDDPAIASLNKRVNLPHQKIVVIRRAESSGDTALFTSYLAASHTWRFGVGTMVRWPAVAGADDARGNDGMVAHAGKTPYSIAYIGISYYNQMQKAGLDTAALQSRDGAFVLASTETIEAAVRGSRMSADARTPLILRPGANAYPIVTYEYAIVRERQGDAARADALKNFLSWAINPNGGNSLERFLSDLNFVPLPEGARAISEALIARIHA